MNVICVILCVAVSGRVLRVTGVDLVDATGLITIDSHGVQGRGVRITWSIVGGRAWPLSAGGRDVEEPFQEAEPTPKVVESDRREVLDPVRRHASTVGRAAAMERGDDGRVV